jgi:hypothetical protein
MPRFFGIGDLVPPLSLRQREEEGSRVYLVSIGASMKMMTVTAMSATYFA